MTDMAKGLGKISDYVKPFDASKPSEFGQFIEKFERGIRTLDIHPTKHYLVLINCLEGRPQDAAEALRVEFETTYPEILNGNRDQKLARARELYQHLKTQLAVNPLVVGINPADKLYEKWGKLTQGPNEPVRIYHHRFTKLEEKLRNSNPPLTFNDTVKLNTFIGLTEATGLLPDMQRHVRLQPNPDRTVEIALGHAQRFEDQRGPTTIDERHTVNSVTWLSTGNNEEEEPQPRQPKLNTYPISPQDTPNTAQYNTNQNAAHQYAAPSTYMPQHPRNQEQYSTYQRGLDWNRGKAKKYPVRFTSSQTRYPQPPPQTYQPPTTQHRSMQKPSADTPNRDQQRAQRRGHKMEICIDFLTNQRCRWGDDCHRMHLTSLEASKDTRPGVKTRPTTACKEVTRLLLEARNKSREIKAAETQQPMARAEKTQAVMLTQPTL